MLSMIFALLMEIAWPLAAVVIAALAYRAGSQWLQRRAVDITKHVDERDAEWAKVFEEHKRETNQRLAHVERNLSANQPDFHPMGKQYNPRA